MLLFTNILNIKRNYGEILTGSILIVSEDRLYFYGEETENHVYVSKAGK